MKTLIERLNHIQRKAKAVKGAHNPSGNFNYRTCDQILEAAKPHMGTEYAILMTDEVVEIGARLFVKATAALTDGADSVTATGYAQIADKIMSMSAPQLTGTSSTYARKLALTGLLMLDDNPDVDSRNQYAEEVEDFARLVADNESFKLYHFTQGLEPEAWQGLWAVYKGEHIPKGEIQVYRQRIKDMTDAGRKEALRAQDAFVSDDESEALEALEEYTVDEQEFIRGLS